MEGESGLSSDMKSFKKAMDEVYAGQAKEHQQWNPYSFEGGTISGIAGDDFVVVASDTRMSYFESAVLTRDCKKLHILNNYSVIGGCMFYGDMLQLIRLLQSRMMSYTFNYRETMKADTIAELLSRSLYQRRFFPYYAWNLVGGIDSKGKGALYSYDPIGCVERVPYVSAGTANDLIDPFLDNQVGWCTQNKKVPRPPLTVARAQALLKDAFRSAAERETCTGDKLHMVTIVAGQPPHEEKFKLRED